MNTIKKISTIFALALISQSSMADNANLFGAELNLPAADQQTMMFTIKDFQDGMYTPNLQMLNSNANILSSNQNLHQNSATNNIGDLSSVMSFDQTTHHRGDQTMAGNTSSGNIVSGSAYDHSQNTTSSTFDNTSTNSVTSDSKLSGSQDTTFTLTESNGF